MKSVQEAQALSERFVARLKSWNPVCYGAIVPTVYLTSCLFEITDIKCFLAVKSKHREKFGVP